MCVGGGGGGGGDEWERGLPHHSLLVSEGILHILPQSPEVPLVHVNSSVSCAVCLPQKYAYSFRWCIHVIPSSRTYLLMRYIMLI